MVELPRFHSELAKQLVGPYPNLHLVPPFRAELATVRGTIWVVHEGYEVDSFRIEMQVPEVFPQTWPKVWEIGGRIPRIPDRHVFPSDGSLCILLPDEAYFSLSPTLTIRQYLDGPVRNYFIGQCCVEAGQGWPWGERSHGIQGIEEFYQDILGTADRAIVAKFLLMILEGKFKGHWQCPCGSGNIIRRCHREVIFAIDERIPKELLFRYLKAIVQEIQESGQ